MVGGPGLIRHVGLNPPIQGTGPLPGKTAPWAAAELERAAAAFAAAPALRLVIEADPLLPMWRKLAGMAAYSTVCAVARCPIGPIVGTPAAKATLRQARDWCFEREAPREGRGALSAHVLCKRTLEGAVRCTLAPSLEEFTRLRHLFLSLPLRCVASLRIVLRCASPPPPAQCMEETAAVARACGSHLTPEDVARSAPPLLPLAPICCLCPPLSPHQRTVRCPAPWRAVERTFGPHRASTPPCLPCPISSLATQELIFQTICNLPADNTPSMWRDMAAGKPSELYEQARGGGGRESTQHRAQH